MFEQFGRGFKMIGASIKLGWEDKRLLLPSILTVLTNLVFGMLLLWQGVSRLGPKAAETAQGAAGALNSAAHGAMRHMGDLAGATALNGPLDPSGAGGFFNQLLGGDNALVLGGIMFTWWMCNRFFEGLTTILVYSHLTEGPGSGKFSDAVAAVFSSLPAIVTLGIVTFICKKLCGWLKDRNHTGALGFGFNFLAGVVQIFWTLAGHLILPAIVIEGTSFIGGLKRADRIAQGNLLTIGVGEVGVDVICRIGTGAVYAAGMAGIGAGWYTGTGVSSPLAIGLALAWALAVVLVTAASIYIRSAFYTCLYVWAVDAEAVHVNEREDVAAPAPLAAALA